MMRRDPWGEDLDEPLDDIDRDIDAWREAADNWREAELDRQAGWEL